MARFASFWRDPALSAYEHLCISSFIKAGHEYFLYTYDPNLEVPEECELRAATEFYSQDKVFFYQQTAAPKVSAFSNMFRYRMVHETGYCWVDTDILCLSRHIDDTVSAR